MSHSPESPDATTEEKRLIPNMIAEQKLEFPPSPPPKSSSPKRLEPIPLDYSVSEMTAEAQYFASTGNVGKEFSHHTPNSVMSMTDSGELENLWLLYFPSSQPRNHDEEAYFAIMREAIDHRLDMLEDE